MFNTDYIDKIEDSYARQCLRIVGSKHLNKIKRAEAYNRLVNYEPLYEIVFNTDDNNLRDEALKILEQNNNLNYSSKKKKELKDSFLTETKLLPKYEYIYNKQEKDAMGEYQNLEHSDALYYTYLNHSNTHFPHKMVYKYKKFVNRLIHKYERKAVERVPFIESIAKALSVKELDIADNAVSFGLLTPLSVNRANFKIGSALEGVLNGFSNADNEIVYDKEKSKLKAILNENLDEEHIKLHMASGIYFRMKSEMSYEDRLQIAKEAEAEQSSQIVQEEQEK